MRDEFYCTQDVLIRERFDKIYKTTSASMILLSLLSAVYFLFWIGASCDISILEAGKSVFEPLAKLLNNGATGTDIYLNTSRMCLFSLFALFAIRIISSKEEVKALNKYMQKEEIRLAKEKLDIQKTCINTYESTKTYSICLSIDYEAENNISLQRKTKLNNVIFDKIAKTLILVDSNSQVLNKDVLIFSASDFMKYDKVYGRMLKELSLAKEVMRTKYKIKLIPSITTDAFATLYDINSIREQHFEIKTFNFKNRSLTTSAFSDKYKYLKQNKYAGTPIGEYVYFGNKKTGTYELNVVHKNLEKILTQI